jgi:chromosome segregation ATPase
MSVKPVLLGACGAAAVLISYAAAQPPPAQPRSLEERVTALERSVASLSTRFETRDASVNRPGSDVAGSSSFMQLQNELTRLQNDLQRVERQADAAAREASDARRDAQDAQREARAAALRTR